MNKKFCPAPFIHTYVNANNSGFKLCCMSHIIERWDTTKDLRPQFDEFWKGDTMQDIRLQFLAGKMPDACEWWCGRWEKEGLEERSDRLHFVKKAERMGQLTYDVEYGTEEFKAPVDIDLRPSRKCNIKCRSCNSTWSDTIAKEVQENPEIQGWGHWDTKIYEQNFVLDLPMDNLQKLSMSGGESLVDEGVLKILKDLCDSGKAKDVHLHLITNCTVLPQKTIDLLTQFNKLTFSLSVDGVGKTDEFLRHGTKWDKKVQNIDTIFNLPNLWYAYFMHVFQPVSAFQFEENLKFFLHYSRKYGDKVTNITYNPIVDPWYLSVSILDDDHKEQIRNTIDDCVNKYNLTDKEKVWLKQAYSELDITHPEERKRTWQNDFVRAEMALNKIRGTDTLSVEPQLKRYFDNYDPTNLTPDKGTGANPGVFFAGLPKPAAKSSHRNKL